VHPASKAAAAATFIRPPWYHAATTA
jgi:hypothetical protein